MAEGRRIDPDAALEPRGVDGRRRTLQARIPGKPAGEDPRPEAPRMIG